MIDFFFINTDDFFKWIPFIIYPITHIKNKFVQFILILVIFIICYMTTNYWSKKSQNQKFKQFVQEKLETDNEINLRPNLLEDFIGQEQIKANLGIFIQMK